MGDRFATVEQLAAGDPQATRVVYGIVIALAVIGILLVVLAIWMIRRTKADLELLGPLERMSDSKWRKGDQAARQAMLDEVRPAGAVPSATPAADVSAVELPPPVADLETPAEPEPVEPEPVEPEPVEPVEPVEPEPVEPELAEPAAVPAAEQTPPER